MWTPNAAGPVFDRGCPLYAVRTPGGSTAHVLVNRFKSQSGGGGPKRNRQAAEVRRIVDGLVAQGQHVVLLGDLNEGSAGADSQVANLSPLFDNHSSLIDRYSLLSFQVRKRPGTFDTCRLINRLDHIFISQTPTPQFDKGAVFRVGL